MTTTVPTAGDEERLVERATYMVGNPSAWNSYDEGASDVIRDLLADNASLRQERDEARELYKKEQEAWMDLERANRELFDGAVDDLLKIKAAEAALTASNVEAERRAKEAERDKTDLAYAKQALNRETARALRFGRELSASNAEAERLRESLRQQQEMTEVSVFVPWLRTWCKARFGKWITHNTAKGALEDLRALQGSAKQ